MVQIKIKVKNGEDIESIKDELKKKFGDDIEVVADEGNLESKIHKPLEGEKK